MWTSTVPIITAIHNQVIVVINILDISPLWNACGMDGVGE